jgi:hypothetical protein
MQLWQCIVMHIHVLELGKGKHFKLRFLPLTAPIS